MRAASRSKQEFSTGVTNQLPVCFTSVHLNPIAMFKTNLMKAALVAALITPPCCIPYLIRVSER